MNPNPARSQFHTPSPGYTVRHTTGGNLAPHLAPFTGGLFIHEQPHQFGAQIGCAARSLLPAPGARARRHNSGFLSFSRESRPLLPFVNVDDLSHVDGSLGCRSDHNRRTLA